MFEKLKAKWNIKSNLDVILILLVFSLAGSSILFVRKPFFHIIGVTEQTPFLIKFFLWLLIVFPTYQINLLIFAVLLGQFQFFWEKEKQMGRFFLKLFRIKKRKA